MTTNKNLKELQTLAYRNHIAQTSEIDGLIDKIEEIKTGEGYMIIANANKNELETASGIVSKMTDEHVTPIALDVYSINHTEEVLPEYQKSFKAFGKSDGAIYLATTVKDMRIENVMSFADMFSSSYQNYNVSAHMKVIDSNTDILESEKEIFIKETKNSTTVIIDLEKDFKECKNTITKNKSDVIIFKMHKNSKQKLGLLLDDIELETSSVLGCHVVEEDVCTVKNITTEFIESCRERNLHPGAFMYDREFVSVMPRLADDLVRPVEPLNKEPVKKSSFIKCKAWS